MNTNTSPQQLSGPQRLAVSLVPWAFVVALAALYVAVLLPRARDGQWLAVCASIVFGLVLTVVVIAAITFSRDILTGRWP